MKRDIQGLLVAVVAVLLPAFGEESAPSSAVPSAPAPPLVVLDIGHFIGSGGAEMPGRINGKRFSEVEFWYRYCYDVKETVQAAGFRCEVCNRGNAPTREPLLSDAQRAGVVHLNHPDTGVLRYPSRHYADRASSGMVSADYAVDRHAACAVLDEHL